MSEKPKAQPAEVLMRVMRSRLAHWDAAKGEFAEGWQPDPETLQVTMESRLLSIRGLLSFSNYHLTMPQST